ncbi:MAG: hypothetical protein EZS28_035053 [Streblomastix strix]|uniref:Uncharacterized protein n=1 Tax=Streblomastix strix TaxID=222440 RepID=A0A5J4UHD1_9EUKA|nr:MAG: hypothetical protein EZS28_035053 [Streblomastix strix]
MNDDQRFVLRVRLFAIDIISVSPCELDQEKFPLIINQPETVPLVRVFGSTPNGARSNLTLAHIERIRNPKQCCFFSKSDVVSFA